MPQPRGPCDVSSCRLQLWGPPRTGGLQAPEPAALAKVRGIGTSWGLSGRASLVPRWQRLGAVCRCDATGLLTATCLRCSSDRPWTRSRQVCMGEQDQSHFTAMETDARKSQDHLSPELLPTPRHTHTYRCTVLRRLFIHTCPCLSLIRAPSSPHPLYSKVPTQSRASRPEVTPTSASCQGRRSAHVSWVGKVWDFSHTPSHRKPWFRACPAGHLLSTRRLSVLQGTGCR